MKYLHVVLLGPLDLSAAFDCVDRVVFVGETRERVLVTGTPDPPPHWNSVLCPRVGWLKCPSLVGYW